MNAKTFYPLLVTVLLALLGIAAKYWNDLRIAQRKDRLERVNLQLRDLYGPLYALEQAGLEAWRAFRSKVRPGGAFFDEANPPSSADLIAWRLWMTEVFMPLNLRMESVVIANTQLVVEGAMPQCLKDLCAHVAAYKPVIKAWGQNDFTVHLSVINYPRALRRYVSDSYFRLIQDQRHLLGLNRHFPDGPDASRSRGLIPRPAGPGQGFSPGQEAVEGSLPGRPSPERP